MSTGDYPLRRIDHAQPIFYNTYTNWSAGDNTYTSTGGTAAYNGRVIGTLGNTTWYFPQVTTSDSVYPYDYADTNGLNYHEEEIDFPDLRAVQCERVSIAEFFSLDYLDII